MSQFSYDMDAAPKGFFRKAIRVIGKNEVEVEEHVPVQIIAAGADGVTVTLSKWLPKEERWNMFSKAHPPIAWALWPDHPGVLK